MKGYASTSYGDSYSTYETTHSNLYPDPKPMLEVLARYAEAGPALELGIGSGRIARPLAERGIEVDGVEVSEKMIEQLIDSSAGLPIRALRGSFADIEPPRSYRLVYCVVSTFFCLATKNEQEGAFATIARALDSDGVCILETYTPDPARFERGQEVKIVELTVDSVTLQLTLHHPESQVVESQRLVARDGRIQLHPVVTRYASPEELDEMAGKVGLRLRERWADWNRAPFTEGSPRHVSFYERAT